MANGIFTTKQQAQGVRQKLWTTTVAPSFVDALVIAGGGGSPGGTNAGGGGAGGFVNSIVPVITGSALTVTVGAGGTAGANGSNSVFRTTGATGGGTSNAIGGSGGGTSPANWPYGPSVQGLFGQGNPGGPAQLNASAGGEDSAGGGGGAGSTGSMGKADVRGGGGGYGAGSRITGTTTVYAGGGGGTMQNSSYTIGNGGVGGGGTGASGTANTGGGAGSAYGSSTNGGSGIVVISYPDTFAAATSTTGSPTVSTSGSGSVSFSGSSQYLVSGTSANFSLGTSDFSVECWVYKTSTVGDQIAVASSVTGNLDPLFFYFGNGSNSAVLYLSSAGSSFDIASAVTVGTVSLNTWAHLAVTRVGTTFTTYLNGAVTSSFTNSASVYKSVNSYTIGAGQTSINAFKGYVSNVRVLKGSSAYSGAFTPSTTPLTPITNTVLLVNTVSGAPFVDSSTTSTTFTATGSPTWNQLSPFSVTGYKNRVYTWTSSGSITF